MPKFYKNNRNHAINKVLNGEYNTTSQGGPGLTQLQTIWKNVFENASETDNTDPPNKQPPVMDLEAAITTKEVNFAKNSAKKDGASGLDNISMKDLNKIPPLELTQRFNIWLLTSYVSIRCKKGVTTLFLKRIGARKLDNFYNNGFNPAKVVSSHPCEENDGTPVIWWTPKCLPQGWRDGT